MSQVLPRPTPPPRWEKPRPRAASRPQRPGEPARQGGARPAQQAAAYGLESGDGGQLGGIGGEAADGERARIQLPQVVGVAHALRISARELGEVTEMLE